MNLLFLLNDTVVYETACNTVPPGGSRVSFRIQVAAGQLEEGTFLRAIVAPQLPNTYEFDLLGGLQVRINLRDPVVLEPPLEAAPSGV